MIQGIEVLGLQEVEKPENRKKNGGFWLQAGDSQVHVGLEDGIERDKTKLTWLIGFPT